MKTEPPNPIEQHKAKYQQLRARIASHPFLKGMPADQLATLAIYSMESSFTAGQSIFHEGDIANRFYLIEEGSVALEMRINGGDPIRIETIGAGEVLGWSWLLPPYTWHFEARAIEPVKAIFLYGTRLRERCEEDSRLGHELMQRVSAVAIDRLNALRRRLAELLRAQRQRPAGG